MSATLTAAGEVPVRGAFLGEAAIRAELARRQAAFAAPPAEDRRTRIAVLGWQIAGERLALPLADIREVAALPPVTRVPGAPPGLAGVVAWRGGVVNLFDPARALGIAGTGEAPTTMLVLRHDRPPIAIAVAEAMGIDHVLLADAEAPPSALHILAETPGGDRLPLIHTSMFIDRLLAGASTQEG